MKIDERHWDTRGQLVEVLRCNFSLTQALRRQCGPGVNSLSDRNEYLLVGKGGRYGGMTTFPPSFADYL